MNFALSKKMPIHLSACQGSRERADHLHRPRAQHLRRPRPEVYQGPHQGQGLRQPLGHGDRPQHRVQRLAGRILRRRKRNVEVLAWSVAGWPDVQTKIGGRHFKNLCWPVATSVEANLVKMSK